MNSDKPYKELVQTFNNMWLWAIGIPFNRITVFNNVFPIICKYYISECFLIIKTFNQSKRLVYLVPFYEPNSC